MKNLPRGAAAAVILSAWLGGCASTGSVAPGQLSLENALVREATLTESYAVASEDRFFSATVAGSASPAIAPHERLYQLTVPIDSEIPAECFVYRDALDSASTLKNLLGNLLADFPSNSILKIDAGTFGQLPYLYQESLYMTEQGAAGVLKGLVVPVGSSTLACIHDEPGYSATFRQMVGGLAGSLRIADAAPESWKYQEILVWQLRDLKVGYTVNSIGEDADGRIRSVVETAVILPRSASETMTHDGYDVTFENTDGELVNGSYAEAENGDITLLINLEKTAQGKYRVAGEFQGKAIDSQLESAQGLPGPYSQYLELVRAANPGDGRPRTLSTDAYIPSANPVQPIAVEAKPTGRRVGDLPEYAMLFSGLEATSVIDANGAKTVTVQMGPVELQLDRVYISGHI